MPRALLTIQAKPVCLSCRALPSPGWGARHTLAVLGCLGFFVSFSLRVNISMAIVAMVNHTALAELAHHHAAGPNASAAPDVDICHPDKKADQSEEKVFTEVSEGRQLWLRGSLVLCVSVLPVI